MVARLEDPHGQSLLAMSADCDLDLRSGHVAMHYTCFRLINVDGHHKVLAALTSRCHIRLFPSQQATYSCTWSITVTGSAPMIGPCRPMVSCQPRPEQSPGHQSTPDRSLPCQMREHQDCDLASDEHVGASATCAVCLILVRKYVRNIPGYPRSTVLLLRLLDE